MRYLASVAAKGKMYGKTVRQELCLSLLENNFSFSHIGKMNFLKPAGFLFMLEIKKGIYDCVQLGRGECFKASK